MVPPVTSALALMAKRPKPPPGSGFCPAQISVSRSEAASAAKRAVDLERRLDADRAFEGGLHGAPATRSFRPVRLPASAAAKSASVTVSVERLVMPDEAAGGAEALGDRRPGERECTSSKRLVQLVRGLSCSITVPSSDAHLGEGRRPLRVRLLAARQRLDQAGPVRAAVRLQVDRDGRVLQRHVGDLDAAGQQREEAQTRGQPLGGERRLAWRRRAPRRRSSRCRWETASPWSARAGSG